MYDQEMLEDKYTRSNRKAEDDCSTHSVPGIASGGNLPVANITSLKLSELKLTRQRTTFELLLVKCRSGDEIQRRDDRSPRVNTLT